MDTPAALGNRFPSTRQSLLERAHSEDMQLRRDAWDAIVEAYWKPVYKYILFKWRKKDEDAQDLTQDFFRALLDRGILERFDSSRASFRTYLRICLDRMVLDEIAAAGRQKRGGGAAMVSLDFASANREWKDVDQNLSPEELFHREWQRHMFSLAVVELKARCVELQKQMQAEIFCAYDLTDGDRPSYEDLARKHGIPITQVTNALAWARRELRRLLLLRLGSITASQQELRAEARELLGR